MLDTNDTTYYNVSGVLFYDPVIVNDEIQTSVPAVGFIDYWKGLFPFNDT